MKTYLPLLAFLALAVSAGSVQAAGSAVAGKAKSAVCASCHGPDGNSAAPNFPKLAGMDGDYIAKQLADFKSGARKDPMMAGFSAALSKKDMQDLGAFYATQKRTTGTAKLDDNSLKLAERVYRGGSARHAVAACMSCHGPDGAGIPVRFPAVSGQHAAYSAKQLLDFKSGARSNDGGVMTDIAFGMSEAEIKAVAEYMAGLR